jgi:hypothetical protein
MTDKVMLAGGVQDKVNVFVFYLVEEWRDKTKT